MTAPRDPDRMIHAFIGEGADRLADPVYDAVRAEIDTKRQRVVIGPWRMPAVNKLVPLGLGAAAVVLVLVVGAQVVRPQDPNGALGAASSTSSPEAPSPSAALTPASPPAQASSGPDGAIGGTVSFQVDGAPATTEVDAVAEGPGVSGTAVTRFSAKGTHTVRLECAARDGDTWALGGTTGDTSVPGERAGDWSAVIVRDGSPQRVGIWLSDAKSEGMDCAGWLAGIDFADLPAEFLEDVEFGALVPPPGAGT